MPTFDENLSRFKGWSRETWTKVKTRRPSKKAALITLGSIGGVLTAFVLVLGLMDWNYLRGPVERIASDRLGRAVHIDGDLDVEILRWAPEVDVRGLRIANPAWAKGDMTRIERLHFTVKLLPLLQGDVIMPLLQIEKPAVGLIREASGRNNWTFKKGSKRPLSLPPIRRFEINNGALAIDDGMRKLVFRGRVTSSEIQDGKSVQAFKLLGDGTLNGAKFDLDLTGGPLLNVDPNRPYPFNARVSAGATRVAAQGTIKKPFNFAVFDTSLSVQGNDMADLYFLTGLAFPNTPPYEVSGQLARRTFTYSYNGLNGRVGDSDLHGDVEVQTLRKRPLMTASLTSRKLDFDDLATILGAGAQAKRGETASPEQAATARKLAVSQRLFPDAPLRVERLRAMDAKVSYRAATVVSSQWPVRKASVDLTLQDAVLTMDPLVFGLDRGQLAGLVAINAKQNIPAVNMDVRLTGASVQEFIPANFKPLVSGGLVGRAKLAGSGLSVRDVAASSNGQVTLVVPSGEIRKGVAEMMGVNVLNALFADKADKTPVRCAVADFKVTGGMMTAQTIVFDTGPVIVSGGGTINLKNEQMDIRVKGHPKKVRLLRLSLPLELQGPLRQPDFGVDPGAAVGQGAIAATLATILSPLAVILPFVDSGMADDANCKALIGEAGSGAPKRQTAEKAKAEKRS